MFKMSEKYLYKIILNSYLKDFEKLRTRKKVHFASRLYFWTRNDKYMQLLESLKNDYVGADLEGFKFRVLEQQNYKIPI